MTRLALLIAGCVLAISAQDCGRIDLVMIVDNSGSIMQVFEKEKSLALDLVGGIPVQAGGSQVGIVTFAANAKVDLPLYPAKSRDQVLSTVSDIEFLGGSTNVLDAFNKAQSLFANSNAPKKVIVVVTDGNSQNKWTPLYNKCKAIRNSGIEILATTQSTEYSEKELILYTGDRKKVFVAGRVKALRALLTKYTGANCPKPPKPVPGTVAPPVPTQPTQTVAPTRRPIVGSCKADVLFVIDTSGSVVQDFRKEVQYAEQIIDAMKLSPTGHQIGVIEYSASNKQQIVVPFGQFQSTTKELVDKLDSLEYYGGTTYTAKALELAKTMITTTRRPDTDLILILVHDGITYDKPVPIAKEIRALPRTTILAAGVNKLVLKETLIDIAGDPSRVFIGQPSSGALIGALAPYLTCGGGPQPPRPTQGVGQTNPPATNAPATNPPATNPPTGNKQTTPRPKPKTTPAPVATTPAPATVQPGPGNCIFDILLVLDTSNSVKGGIFANEIERALKIVDRFNIGGGEGTRFGFVDFAGIGTANTEFPLNKYKMKSDIKDAIRNAKFIAGTTAAGDALELAAKELAPSRGGRPGKAEQIVIFISDGLSQQSVDGPAEALKRVADRVYAVATDKFYGPDQLKKIASDDNKWFHIIDPPEKVRWEAVLDALAKDC